MGVLYILDEPSIGLHQRDNDKLLAHAASVCATSAIRSSWSSTTRTPCARRTIIVDIGPGAGVHGGRRRLRRARRRRSWRTKRLRDRPVSEREKEDSDTPKTRRAGNGKLLTVRGAQENNLKNIDVSVPLGTFTCVTGVSGSAANRSLVNEIIYKKLARGPQPHAKAHAGKHRAIEGVENLDKVICIDQSPIGRTPRSNPATYTDLFNDIRDLFASTPDAKARGYNAGRFCFNVQRRTLRGLRRRRSAQDRDALPAGYLRSLRGVQGQTLQPRDAGGPL